MKMKEYIGKKMIEDGLMAKVIIPTIKEGELAAIIGDNWFWFDNGKLDYDNVEDITFYLLVDGIKDTLDAFYEDGKNHEEMKDEYLYYYYYLCENI